MQGEWIMITHSALYTGRVGGGGGNTYQDKVHHVQDRPWPKMKSNRAQHDVWLAAILWPRHMHWPGLRKGALCTANKKKKEGGGRKPQISAQYEVRLKMATAQLRQMLRSCAWWLCRVRKKNWSSKKSRAERIWTDDHSLKTLRSIHLSYLWIDECTWKKISQIMLVTATECTALRQEKKVWFAWIHLNIAKFSLFHLSTNLCGHWCWSLSSRSYPNPLKNRKSDSKSLTRIAQHRISCGSACLMQVRPSPFWGAPRTVVKPRASPPPQPFFLPVHNTPLLRALQYHDMHDKACRNPTHDRTTVWRQRWRNLTKWPYNLPDCLLFFSSSSMRFPFNFSIAQWQKLHVDPRSPHEPATRMRTTIMPSKHSQTQKTSTNRRTPMCACWTCTVSFTKALTYLL